MIGEFLKRFSVSKRESDALFDATFPDVSAAILSSAAFDDGLMLQSFDPALDASPQEGGTLRTLQLNNIGPTTKLDFSPAERLSMITGDNGLGKTFVLDVPGGP